MKDIEVTIYPVAYVCVNDLELMDMIRDELNPIAEGDGQVMCNADQLESDLKDMGKGKLKTALKGILKEVNGRAGDVWIYCR